MKPRTYPVPEGARFGLLASGTATLDQIEVAAAHGNPWAQSVAAKEETRFLALISAGSPILPVGVLAVGSEDLVVALARPGGVWRGSKTGWVDEALPDHVETLALTASDCAFVARAFDEGADAVQMVAYVPPAWLTAAATTADPVEVPDGAKVIAVVDEMDRNAVIDMVAVTPGPHVLRRHDGAWMDDDGWLGVLRSVAPPPVVVLNEGQVASVAAQIDQATAGQPYEPTDPKAVTSSIVMRAGEMALAYALSAAGAARRAKYAAYDVAGVMPPALQRYWTVGEGGTTKIRWGTPGAWRRCRRHLTKYVGPHRAPGACTNLGEKLGGKGVAWDVTRGSRR